MLKFPGHQNLKVLSHFDFVDNEGMAKSSLVVYVEGRNAKRKKNEN